VRVGINPARGRGGRGYTVLEAGDAEEGILRSKQHEGRIDLLITDVVMPGISGPRLAKRLKATRSDMRVLFISGYAEEAALRHGLAEANTDLLVKPFTPDSLDPPPSLPDTTSCRQQNGW